MGRLTQQTLAGKTSQTRSYQYDAASPHAKETFAFDSASNIVNTGGSIATQTNSNNLLRNIPAIVGNLLKEYAGTHFKYDARGNLIEKQQGTQVQKLVWDGDVIALEQTAEQTRHYLFEAGSFVPLAQVVEKDGADPTKTSQTAYYHVDHLGTPQLLTDADGEIAWQAEYKAWGEAKAVISQAAHSAGIDNPLRFQGQYFDAESGTLD